MKYSAFISYRHGGMDEFAAKNLQRMMESYHLPPAIAKKTGQKKIGRIFRDTDELPTSGSLYENIEEALKETEYLIVICTPRLKESKWCMRELELFISLRGADHVLAVLAEGEPEDSFPEVLRFREEDGQRVEVEPLAADVRSSSPHGMKKKMKIERLRLLAAIIQCDFDQLRQRARIRQRQQRIGLAAAAVGILSLFLGMMTRENIKLQHEVSKTQEAQSYLLSQYAGKQYQGDDRVTASLLALAGLPDNLGDSRPFVSASLSALTQSLQIYNYQQGYIPDKIIQTRTMDSAAISPDGRWVAYTDLIDSTTYNTHFYDTASGKVMKDFPTDYDYCPYGSSKAKAVFFGKNRCALAGADGVMVIDTDTMKVLWTGNAATMVEVSKDESTIAACDYRTNTVNFYKTDGTLLSSTVIEGGEICVPLGLTEDGTAFSVDLCTDGDPDQMKIVETKTGKIIKTIEGKKGYNICMYTSSWTNDVFPFLYDEKDGDNYYGWYDLKKDEVHYTDAPVINLVEAVDVKKGVFYTAHGNQLDQVDIKTGKVKGTYSAGGNIATTVDCGDGRWEIICSDGALEYMEFGEVPYCISRMSGNGTGCTDAVIGGKYMATYLVNTYKVNLYQLNEKSSKNKAVLKRQGEETTVYAASLGNLLEINTTINSYTINMDTLAVQKYISPISFLNVGNENSVLLDELDGNYTVYDKDTAEKKTSIPSDCIIIDQGGFFVDTDTHTLSQYDYDSGKVVGEYKVPKTCVSAIYVQGQLVCDCVDGEVETVEIYEDEKQILKQEVTSVDLATDYVRYVTADQGENVIYDLNQKKEIFRADCGNADWSMPTQDHKFIFVSSTDQGGYVINHKTGEVVLTLSDSSTIYSMMSWEDSAYFAFLSISDSGSTNLDIYLKEHPDSPIAQIPGGMGLNSKDQAIIYDGEGYVYAVPVMAKEDVYQAGINFVDNKKLTERQKTEFHCQ